jgi:hypothetical protein
MIKSAITMFQLSMAMCLGCESDDDRDTETPVVNKAEHRQINNRAAEVVINGVALTEDQLNALARRYGARLTAGRYWYDRVSGAWGLEGFPCLGFCPAGLNIGGQLRADASNGNTGVFVNGRELHLYDVLLLQQITPVYRGRFWVDAWGNCGVEGGPALVNLFQLAQQKQRQSGGRNGNYFSVYSKYGDGVSGTTVAGDGEGGYMFSSGGTTWYSGK